jgi:hypothetical protein
MSRPELARGRDGVQAVVLAYDAGLVQPTAADRRR